MDYTGLAFPKGPSRRDEKLKRIANEAAEDRIARATAWKRCEGRCEKCHRRVKRGGGLLDGAEFHHRVLRSKGGRTKPVYLVLCHKCHSDGPSGAHTRTR